MIITYNQFATYYVGLLLCKRETYTYLQYGTQMPHMLADRHVAWSVLVYNKRELLVAVEAPLLLLLETCTGDIIARLLYS